MSYGNLKAEMARSGITKEEISKLLGIHRNSVYKKLHGGKFYADEAFKIQKAFFPTYSIDYLFDSESESEM